jgi:DNA processing protein
MDSREALVVLNMVDHVGPVRLRHLLNSFGAPEAILKASKSQLLAVHGIGQDTATAISNWETTVDLAAELKRVADFGCHILIPTDEEYPASLRQIYDPPIVLYV